MDSFLLDVKVYYGGVEQKGLVFIKESAQKSKAFI